MRSCHPELQSKGKTYKCMIANCRSKDKKWPRADNFRQHLKRVHGIQHVDDNLDKYVYTLQASPGPDLAGLGTSVGTGLVSLGINPDGLSSNSWAFSTQSTQEHIPRDPCDLNDYINEQMDFERRTLHTQEHTAITPRVGLNLPDNFMQISPLESSPDCPLIPVEPVHSQAQGLQDFTASSVGDQETDFEESNYFNEASISDNGSQDDEQSIIQDVSELEMTTVGDVCEVTRAVEEPSRRIVAEPLADSGIDPATHEVTTVEDDDTCSMSTSSVSSPPGGGGITQSPLDTITCLKVQVDEARLDVTDVLTDQGKAYDFIKALKDKGLLAGLLEKVDYEKPKHAEVPAKADVLTKHEAGKTLHACPRHDCEKSFHRQCELRKHMKRHAKPYGCTFPQCTKRFGSKNDWKRHENSQHYQLELWKCNEMSKLHVGELCNRPYSRREQFKTHLSKDHGITESATIDQKLEDCLDGRNYEVRFWCGFCRKMVKVKEKGLKAWLGRFNHIDDHFSGLMDISDWKSPDPGLPEDPAKRATAAFKLELRRFQPRLKANGDS
ncbi:hypothetical protein N0V93_000700 [Gnomoniopsis smithogilvyi]|uniref:C2H2-type domain-containing protein n=1 Tax=Gnomoniopsis smithogilvyi TaxID=1191159 RepID=A0A9W8Z256_9PEZI|nr:hypothetical protein N0V93_000700 [Gnomoniopsis smithogilvyi]